VSKNFDLMVRVPEHREVKATKEITPALSVDRDNGNEQYSRTKPDLGRLLAQEEILSLVQRVFFQHTEEPPRAVVFTGIDHGNGCSRTCIRVAETLATRIGGSICLVDANFRSPSLHGFFGVSNHYGLADALIQEGPIRSFGKQLRPEKLWLLSCGALSAGSSNLMNSERLRSRVAELRKEFDYLLIDAPPLNRYADALALGKLADGFVLILEANSTRRESALKASENLRAANIRVLGAVLNRRKFPIPGSLYHRL
jgi:capsular exopolysaccharide synthesis family protein